MRGKACQGESIMSCIGNVIKEYRNILGMSRRELADGICTEKYVYMIENGERTPSSKVMRLLGDKMGIDLFKYHEYLDCVNPIQVSSAIESFNIFRRKFDLISLAEVTEKAKDLKDFHTEPWRYEIELNHLMIKVFSRGESHDSIGIVQDIISGIKRNYSKDICMVNFYVLLSTCFQMERDLENARKALELAMNAIEGKLKIAKYSHAIISVKINKITLHYLAGELDCVIEEGIILSEYENELCCYERSHHAFFYLAFAYYQKGNEEEGIEWFMKGLFAILIKQRTMDMYYITEYEMFKIMLNDRRISRDLVNKIYERYDIDRSI